MIHHYPNSLYAGMGIDYGMGDEWHVCDKQKPLCRQCSSVCTCARSTRISAAQSQETEPERKRKMGVAYTNTKGLTQHTYC